MITKNDLAAACRAHDNAADVGERTDEILAKRDVRAADAMYVAYQRAMRVVLLGRGVLLPNTSQPVELTAAEDALVEKLAVIWLDGLIVGLKVKEDLNGL